TTIAVTFTVGLGGLEDAQLAERDTNVERAFDVLHDNFNDLSRDGVPSRATELRLGGGTLTTDANSRLAINGSAGGGLANDSTAVVYRGAGDTEIRYEYGAVIRTDGGGSVMIREPDLLVGDRTVFGFVDLRPRGDTTVGGERTVLVRATLADDRSVPEAGESVTLSFEGPTVDAWERYFEDRQDDRGGEVIDGIDRTGDELEVTMNADEGVAVHRTTVVVRFSD
ncbi:hypothetical protein U4E84_17130, partial [Halorubrum sp. AD140]|uniref:DUF7289 family protein n=1 Tax=Halorubrum sp. AD140 TaxID=3050073 RepID=UPI002ACD1683